jgi:ankyrin repeat protein
MRKKVQRRLMSAVMFGEPRLVARVLRSGADPNLADREDGTPLYQASVCGRGDVVRMLVRAGADPNAREDQGEGFTAAEWAARGGTVQQSTHSAVDERANC